MSEPTDATAPQSVLTTEQLGEIVRIVDPELDVEAILAEIRANLASRPPLDPDPRSFAYRPGDATSVSGQMEVDWQIDQAAEYARSLAVGEQMRPGGGALAGVTARLKRPLHQLVRYYVDLLAQRQSALEGHVIGALRALSARSTATDEEIARLRKEVAELRGRLESDGPSHEPPQGPSTRGTAP